MPGATLSADEVRLAKQWAIQDSEAPSEIARRLGRNKSTITRLLKKRSPPKRRGVKVGSLYLQCLAYLVLGHSHGVRVCGLRRVLFLRLKSVPQVKLTVKQVDMLVAKLKDMVARADAKYEVTLPMLKRSARCKASSLKSCRVCL